jgi:hypothetical protein
MTFHQRTDETFSENRQASRQSARPVSAPRTRIIRPSRLRGGTPAVRPPLLRSPASKPHGSLMRQLRRAVGADPSLKRQAKPDRRSASRRSGPSHSSQRRRSNNRTSRPSIGLGNGEVERAPSLSGTIRRSVGWLAGALTCVPQPERAEPMPRALLGGAFFPVGVSVF